jgi:hypothetical protein
LRPPRPLASAIAKDDRRAASHPFPTATGPRFHKFFLIFLQCRDAIDYVVSVVLERALDLSPFARVPNFEAGFRERGFARSAAEV